MQREGGCPERFWARHKTQAVLRLLRGEHIDLMSRELGVAATTLSQWRDTFLEAGELGLKPQPIKESAAVGRLWEKIGEQAMEKELLHEKIARLEQNRPLARGRSRKCAKSPQPPRGNTTGWRWSAEPGRSLVLRALE